MEIVQKLLIDFGQSFIALPYGNYNENEFLELMTKSKYCFLLNGTESQGIAVQEIMSCNLPIFAWDVERWADRGEEHTIEATSVPYWFDECGLKETNKSLLYGSFSSFLKNINNYNPRKYVLDNLGLAQQAIKVLDFFK